VNAVAVGSVSLAFLAVAELVREFFQLAPDQIPYVGNYFTWMTAGTFRVDFSLQVDQLTVVMLLVVSFVGLLIHIYSTGYMAHEGGYYRFFSYLNLFMFFMLTLVLGANLIVMFVGWEGVGLCSYLLIGFYFLKKSAADAGKKAFIVTRIGDFGFTVGILLVFVTFGTVAFGDIFKQVSTWPSDPAGHMGTLTIVYMVARMNPLFSRAPMAMLAVAIVGAATAFYSATIGLCQTDIKKVLAYSTVSQLGYMFLGCGVGAYAAGIFHLMTHAFFKGLLFLAAGSVIHAMGGDQEMFHMGGLRKKIPITFWTMFAATLAIAGAPGFAGFFSKDEILEATRAASAGNTTVFVLWLLGVAAAGITSFYMFRLLFLTFFGKPRYDEHKVHVHESPRNMTIPLILLAVLSVGGGWIAAPHFAGGTDYFEKFLHPVFSTYAPADAMGSDTAMAVASSGGEATASAGMEIVHSLTGWPVIVALIGFLLAWWFYIKSPEIPKKIAKSVGGLYTVVFNKYYVDEIYAALIVRPLLWISTNVLWHVVDEGIIDGALHGIARGAQESGSQARQLQSGNARSYAAWVVIGAVGFTVLLLVLWTKVVQ
jgi:NADH-quinone oxidoreductase subunit L